MSSDFEPDSILFDRYDIIKKLGEGTWGKVYLAYDKNMNRSVAIKHLKAKGDPGAVQRFRHEKDILAQLKHWCIVTVHDFVETESGECFSIMEYIDGGSLKDRLKREGPLAVIDALEVAIEICSALETIHAMRIVHNDLKPGNVLLAQETGELRVKLSDFGSATRRGTEAKYGPLPTGLYSGTFLYSSPELLRQEICDGRSDLYSLGILLYEMLVGEVPFPFSGELQGLLQCHFEKDPVPPSKRRPGFCREVNEVVLKALGKLPDMRYANAHEMLAALISAKQAQIEWHKELEGLYTQGISKMESKQWQEAAAMLGEVAKRHPGFENVEQRFDRACAMDYCEKEEWEKAAESLEKITRQYPDDGEMRAHLKRAQDQLKMASLYSEAVPLQEQGQWTKAINLFGQILAIDPIYRDVPDRLVWVNQQKRLQNLYTAAEHFRFAGDWEEAIENLEKILEVDKEYRDVAEKLQIVKDERKLNKLYAKGIEHLKINEWNNAIEYFEKAALFVPTELDPETWPLSVETPGEVVPSVPIWALASIRLLQAKKLYRISIALDEGKRHLRNGRLKEAIDKFDEVLSLDRGHQEALQKREEAKKRLKQQEEHPKPTEPRGSPSLSLWEKIVLSAVAIALIAGIVVVATVTNVRVNVPQHVQLALGIALVGLGGFTVSRFLKGGDQ